MDSIKVWHLFGKFNAALHWYFVAIATAIAMRMKYAELKHYLELVG
ncbi:MAG: hypothetical protein RL248_854 [Pseudomonadota bacterium]